MVLVCACGALNGQGTRTADGGGEQFAQHALGGARLSHQQQAAFAGQRHDAALHERPRADELGLDRHRPGHLRGQIGRAGSPNRLATRATDEIDDALGRQQPTRRARRQVAGAQEGKLFGKPFLGRRLLHARRRLGVSSERWRGGAFG